jgi:hypothetical protein
VGPFELNSLALDSHGELTRIDPRERPFGFHFECLGLRFVAATRLHNGMVWLQLSAAAGVLPYTAESQERRLHAMAILRASRTLPHGRIGVSRDGQIEVCGEMPLSGALTAVNVLSAAAEMLLELKPYLSLLGDFAITDLRGASSANA